MCLCVLLWKWKCSPSCSCGIIQKLDLNWLLAILVERIRKYLLWGIIQLYRGLSTTCKYLNFSAKKKIWPWVIFFFFFFFFKKVLFCVFYFKPKRNIARLLFTGTRAVPQADVLQKWVLIRKYGLDWCVSQILDLIVNNKSGQWKDICVLKAATVWHFCVPPPPLSKFPVETQLSLVSISVLSVWATYADF